MAESKTFTQASKNPGIVTNLPTTIVPWASGRNVRFRPGAVMKALGKSLLATVSGSLPIREMFTFRGHDQVVRTIVCCDAKVYSYKDDFATVLDITPASPPTGDATSIWTFALIGGMPILSNSVNGLWKWNDFSGILTALSNAPERCRVISSSLGRILAGNIQDGSYDFSGRMKWTKKAFSPTSWVIDTESAADRQDLVNPNTGEDAWEYIQGFGQHGTKRTLIYTSKNIWKADASQSIMDYDIDILFPGKGLVAPRARTHYLGSEWIMTDDDFYQIAGEVKSIGFNIRNSVFPNLNRSYVHKAFAFAKPSTKEVVFCFCTGSNTAPDTAAAYNVELKNWTFYSVNFTAHTYAYTQANYEWDTIPFGTWDSITDSAWDSMSSTGILPYEIVGNSTGQILKLEDTDNDNGTAIEAYLETGDLGPDQGKYLALPLIPFLKPTGSKNPLMVQVGVRKSLDREIQWSQPKPFTEGVSEHVGFHQKGRFCRYRFFTDQKDSPWILEGFRRYFDIVGG